MTNIDASFRRAILPGNRASGVADSKRILAATPQLIMEPGVSRPVYRFDDGDGLTDAFGNVYDGYGSGGFSTTYTFGPAESVDTEVDNANDKDILQYNLSREKYEPVSKEAAQLAIFETGTEQNLDIPQYSSANSQYEPKTLDEIGLAKFGGVAPTDGQIPYWNNANQQYEPDDLPASPPPAPFDITDFISGIIEKPQDRTYTIVQSLPYSINITGTSQSIATGSASINFPAGSRAAGSNLQITVTGSSSTDEFLRFQIDFTRTLTP